MGEPRTLPHWAPAEPHFQDWDHEELVAIWPFFLPSDSQVAELEGR